ncbi:MAG TPA: SigB/SigF/SigG family RNA polymerase sigma factor [Acidimicrobiales bacterium]|jgi:RNA polymerase sigma-B factor|nr:SigB/SigF/SigG family RNA polymerase sigma factor [Acidimicrobiales bacterium]
MPLEDHERAHQRVLFAEYARTRDPKVRDELIAAHLRLARHLARRFSNRGIPLDDLVQVASLGLVNAVDRFDASRGLEFSTFATPTIMGELKRHFRDKGWSVRVPRRIQELHIEMNAVIARLSQQLGRTPTVAELARATGSTEEEILEAMDASQAYRSASIDARIGGDESRTLHNVLGRDDTNMELAEQRHLLGDLLDSLPKREQLMIRLRFWEGMTQSEIAERLGISQMHVSRLLTKSLALMKERADIDPEDFLES